jgi:hypothetical protein
VSIPPRIHPTLSAELLHHDGANQSQFDPDGTNTTRSNFFVPSRNVSMRPSASLSISATPSQTSAPSASPTSARQQLYGTAQPASRSTMPSSGQTHGQKRWCVSSSRESRRIPSQSSAACLYPHTRAVSSCCGSFRTSTLSSKHTRRAVSPLARSTRGSSTSSTAAQRQRRPSTSPTAPTPAGPCS